MAKTDYTQCQPIQAIKCQTVLCMFSRYQIATPKFAKRETGPDMLPGRKDQKVREVKPIVLLDSFSLSCTSHILCTKSGLEQTNHQELRDHLVTGHRTLCFSTDQGTKNSFTTLSGQGQLLQVCIFLNTQVQTRCTFAKPLLHLPNLC